MKLSLLASVAAAAAGVMVSQVAYAQSASEVVVMRRSLDPKTRTYAWVPGEWSQCSNSCGAGQQTRSVQCMMNGKRGTPEVNCTADRPADTQSCYDIQACSYTWQPGEWTDVAGCGKVVETRDLTCLRGDGRTVSNDQCPSPSPDVTREVRDLRTCSYSWKTDQWSAFSSECQTDATSTRNVWCERSNGEKVGDEECSTSGAKPEGARTEDRYGQCGYSWKEKPWTPWSSSCQTGATRTRDVVCLRSNGDEVGDASCADAGPKPAVSEKSDQYGQCSYSWKEQPWGAVVPACGTSSRSRTVQCVRSNGDVVGDSSCNAGAKPAITEAAVDYQTCTYAWNEAAWGTPSSACGNATSTRDVTCLSSDGRTVADSSCSGQKPTATKSTYETSGCSYQWQTAPVWGTPVPACGATVQNRSVTCLRSDGQTVADGSCDATKRPASQQAVNDYTTCTYGWAPGAWGAWSSSCGSATQNRSVTCQSSDGRTVADSFCGSAAKPATAQSAYQTSGCGYTWQTGAFGSPAAACGASIQYRDVWCLRSDGQKVGDESCAAGSRPSATQAAADYSTCSYSWSAGGWSSPSSTCGAATQTRSVTCLRSDGTTVADTSCASLGAKPPTSQNSVQTSSCSYSRVNPTAWSGWDNACSGSARRTRTYQCRRSDGTIVDGGECTTRGISLSETETGANYTNACPGYFSVGGWTDYNSHCSASATRTRTVTCYRSGDNALAGDQYCNDRGLATPVRSETTGVYDQCGYTWSTGGWGAATAACGASTQYRSVWCTRGDGTTVADGNCNASTRPATAQGVTDYSACTFGWAYGGWGTTSQTCGSVTQSRSVWCQRSDGTSVAEGYCGGGKPAASQTFADYSACSYSWVAYGYPAQQAICGTTSHSRDVACIRADGTRVAEAYCNAGTKPATSENYTNYSGCTYYWNAGGWSDYNSHCSASATRTRPVWCFRSDGFNMDTVDGSQSNCYNRAGAKPAWTETTGVYDQCNYVWQASGYSVPSGCGAVTATQDVWCQRSDGTRVADGSCGGSRPSNTTQTTSYSACGYEWKAGGWSAQQAVCTSGTQTRDVWCQRTDGAHVDGSLCGWSQQPASTQAYSNTSGCSYNPGYGSWSACPMGAAATQSRTNTCTRAQTGEMVDPQTYCGIPATQTQACSYNPGGFASGTMLGTYAFAVCSQQYDYGTMGTMPQINPAQCRSGVATYAQQCTNGGNFATNMNCIPKGWVSNPRGPTGYPCDIVCR